MIWPFTRDWTATVSIGATVPSALMVMGTSLSETSPASTGTGGSPASASTAPFDRFAAT